MAVRSSTLDRLAPAVEVPRWQQWARAGLANSGVILASGLLLLVALLVFFGVQIAPYDATAQAPLDRLKPPLSTTASGLHLLGTDQLGRDLLSNIIVATQLTLLIGVVSTIAGCVIGTLLGLAAGYFGGLTDRLIMRLTEAQTAMPMFLVAIFFLSIIGPSVVNMLIILPTLVWPAFARVVRAETLRLRELLFVEAASAIGCTSWEILLRHILPNIGGRIATLFVLEIGHVMLAEAGLSFLGVGIQPPDSTWGLLIARGRQYLAVAWWLAIMPGVALALTVLALNVLARWSAKRGGSTA